MMPASERVMETLVPGLAQKEVSALLALDTSFVRKESVLSIMAGYYIY